MKIQSPRPSQSPFRSATPQPLRFGCRMFGYITPHPDAGDDAFLKQCLLDGGNAMKRQSQLPFAAPGDPAQGFDSQHHEVKNPLLPQKSGWGMAWFQQVAKQDTTTIEKRQSTHLPWRDPQFTQAAREAAASRPKVVLNHLRESFEPASQAHLHPFQFGNWALMHHGDLSAKLVLHLKKTLADLKTDARIPQPKTNSDTELLACFLAARLLQQGGSLDTRAIERQSPGLTQRIVRDSVNELIQSPGIQSLGDVFRSLKNTTASNAGSHPGSLNLIFSDGNQLLATQYLRSTTPFLHVGTHRNARGETDFVIATQVMQPQSGERIHWQAVKPRQMISLRPNGAGQLQQQTETLANPAETKGVLRTAYAKFCAALYRTLTTLQLLLQMLRRKRSSAVLA